MPATSFFHPPPVFFKIAKPKVARKPRPRKPRVLTELGVEVWELLDNRIQEAIEAGIIKPDYDDVEEGEVAPTAGELNTLRRILMREAFREMPPPRPTPHPPGSAAKLAEMGLRAEQGLSTTSPLDADPDGDAHEGVEVIGEGKGAKVKVEVIGWAEP